ncbi:MAG TPA: universal stress protein [Burkholderiaceae bacterium]|jgi:nucleotide-binding universal stress UspA family protein|nr:universal stress protein [Burkholderiaceae bacterium]
MQTILLPVDGSENSSRAVKRAIELCKKSADTKLLLVTAYPPIVSGNVKRYFSAEDIQSFYQEEGGNALKPAKALLDEAGVPYEEEVLVGPVAQSIADYAKKKNADTIIMGTRGLGTVTGMVLGSVTTKVLSLVDIPVLLVK